MKKVFLTLSLFALLVACGSNDAGKSQENEATTATPDSPAGTEQNTNAEPAVVDLSSNPDYKAGLALEAKSDCATCHKLDEKLVGPSFREIAARYTNDPETVDMLAQKIIKGGKGNWGEMMMTPHENLSQEDAKTIVKYILLLKK